MSEETIQFAGPPGPGVSDSSVTNAKMADMAQATIKGRASGAGTGAPGDLTAAQARAILNVEDGAQVNTVSSVASKTGAVTLVKADVGLGSVENLTPANMPVSTAQQAEIDRQARAEAKAAAAATGRARVSYSGYADVTLDRSGKLIEALGLDGLRNLIGVRFISAVGRTSTKYFGPVRDLAGKLLSYYDPTGRFAATGGLHDGETVTPRTSSLYAWGVVAKNGKTPIGLRHEGDTDLIPSETTAGHLYVDPDEFSTEWPVFNVRRLGNGALIATRREADGTVCDIRKLRGKPAAVANGSSTRRLRFRGYLGQSNATNTGVEAAQLTDALYPHHALAFENLVEGYRNVATSPSAFVGLTGIYDPEGEPQWPQTMVAFATEEKRRAAGAPSDGIIYYTSHYGGQPLSSFVDGTVPFANLMLGAEKSVEVARLYGREVDCKSIVYIQGEHGTAPGDFTGYKDAVIALAEDVTDGIQAAMDLDAPPMFVIVQTNEYDDAATADLVFQGQLDAAKESARIVGAMPMYQCPLEDTIHSDTLGRMILGDTLSVVQDIVEETGDFNWLQPDYENTTLVVNTITIPMLVATGTTSIAFDDDWVLTVPDKGFKVTAGGSPVTISSVTPVGTNVVIVLASSPASVTVDYAVLNDATTLNGWANGRGHLYSPTDIDSTYFKLGYAVPEKVRHYCTRFTMDLTA